MLCKFILSRFHLTYKFEPIFLDPFKGILDDFFFFFFFFFFLKIKCISIANYNLFWDEWNNIFQYNLNCKRIRA
jgi:hypothetical protein